jgi:cytokinin dehydrogenase
MLLIARRRTEIRDGSGAVQDAIRFDEAARADAAVDFGHIVHRAPAGVLLPESTADVAAAIRWAGERGYRFAAHGTRHSVYGRAQVADGIVGDMTRLHAVQRVQGDRVTVDAGATWREVLAATLPYGLAPPVLPDYLDLTIGGTLAVGGVGGGISRFGVVADNVVELAVVTGRGEEWVCSPGRHPALFDAVRAGLGQVAVITRATVGLVAAPRNVRRFLLSYPSLATMLRDERLLTADDRFDAVQGAVVPGPRGAWIFRLDAVAGFSGSPPDDAVLLAGLSDDRPRAQPSTVPYLEYLSRLDALEQALRAQGLWSHPHPWLTTFVGDSAVEPVVDGELARLSPADLGPMGQVVVSAFAARPVRTPLLRLPADDLCYAVNLIRLPASGSAAEADRLVAANRAVYERIHAAGGTLYPVSALPMSPADWREHFGPAFPALAAARASHDPDGVLTPGYEVFP